MQVSASSFAQKITLSRSNTPLKSILKDLKEQSGYDFFYTDNLLKNARPVTVDVKNAEFVDVLQLIFSGQQISYAIQNKTVVITENKVAQRQEIQGRVMDKKDGKPIPAVTISIKGTKSSVQTNKDGRFTINIPPGAEALEFRYVGYKTVSHQIAPNANYTIFMEEDDAGLDEVVVTAFGQRQRKEAIVGSVTTITPSTLRVPSSNLTTALAGRIAGVIAYQRTGEPGMDDAQFFIRGVTTFGTGKANPLILIDGVEMTSGDLSRLIVDDIASFSIMKDANATALYGARGANGVILVTTKEGQDGVAKIQFRAETSSSSPTENVRFADPVTFMKLQNEGVRTRMPGTRLPNNEADIYYTELGKDPMRYPAIDWQDVLLDKMTINQRYNLNVSGGGKVARYYIAASNALDNGIIKMDKRQNFNNNIKINKYSLRSNVNVNLTSTTEAIVRLSGTFDNYNGPLDGGTSLYNKAVLANPVKFLPFYAPDAGSIYTNHILFGNNENGEYLNPYAEMMKGYKSQDRSSMYVQFGLKQNLDFLVKGLGFRGMYNVNRFADLSVSRRYNPFFYALTPLLMGATDYKLNALNPNAGTDFLDYIPSDRVVTNTMYLETALDYNTVIKEKSTVSAMLVFTSRENKDGSYNDLQSSLPQRNAGLAGRLTYGYDNRYFAEANFGYNGSERFAKRERWGFFPSAGVGWVVSNEKFWQPLKNVVSKLKLKATYGLVGNDAIGETVDRFYYLSNVNMANSARGFTFGENFGYNVPGISISRYSDPFITWEVSRKGNFGLELNLKNSVNIQVDYFTEQRSKILQTRSDIPSTMGLQATPKSNIGKAKGSGVDFSFDYNKTFSSGLWAIIRGNFTYASSRFELYEEPDYATTPWRVHANQKISQRWGYIAERYFLDDEEIKSSPVQTFGEYKPGDLKYKDINKDGRVDESDMVPIGYPTTPEIIYGFGMSLGYKNFDINCFFQGSALSSFWISPNAIAPFANVNNASTNNMNTNRALLQVIADSHWSEDTRDLFAFYPRLSPENVSNNSVSSTWWMRNGAFLRLKTVEVGYNISKDFAKKVHLKNIRLYGSGNNLLQIRSFKLWDPEQAGNAFNYPIQRVFNFGVNLEF
ncbi:TonB-linked outer membrane protein, SusC/RagA family [Pedobacter nyackensis]|uniref:TonB-linked outer membrane protein, SusC/RagA family n=2 Tax=Pedobacter nyackensis TaxID=475255 RepID=A0A1W2AAK7_9SPHI|nr:TonB-linked outer membrane protein, SusC/RagA family [Pedobacter nyackensis]